MLMMTGQDEEGDADEERGLASSSTTTGASSPGHAPLLPLPSLRAVGAAASSSSPGRYPPPHASSLAAVSFRARSLQPGLDMTHIVPPALRGRGGKAPPTSTTTSTSKANGATTTAAAAGALLVRLPSSPGLVSVNSLMNGLPTCLMRMSDDRCGVL